MGLAFSSNSGVGQGVKASSRDVMREVGPSRHPPLARGVWMSGVLSLAVRMVVFSCLVGSLNVVFFPLFCVTPPYSLFRQQ